jgi:hypothetical protein
MFLDSRRRRDPVIRVKCVGIRSGLEPPDRVRITRCKYCIVPSAVPTPASELFPQRPSVGEQRKLCKLETRDLNQRFYQGKCNLTDANIF